MSTRKRNADAESASLTLGAQHDWLVRLPFPCPNCGTPVTQAVVYCSDLCGDEAGWVRYLRACIKDGRWKQSDVMEAVNIKLAHILAGGYPRRDRQIPAATREVIIARDLGRCQKCGEVGVQIDHISGNSSDPNNLQLLCVRCHNEKTRAGFVTFTAETHPREWEKRKQLLDRAYAGVPVRVCDGEDWKDIWRIVKKARGEVVRAQTVKSDRPNK